jgi:serine/threonine-protein kinase RsbW
MMPERVSATLALPARLTSLDAARQWAAGHARTAAIADDGVFELELAMTEALSNTIRHSYREDESQDIELRLEIDEHQLTLNILDRGEPFDPAAYAPPDFDEPGEGGYGLHIIAALTFELTRVPLPGGGTLVRLSKNRTIRNGDER